MAESHLILLAPQWRRAVVPRNVEEARSAIPMKPIVGNSLFGSRLTEIASGRFERQLVEITMTDGRGRQLQGQGTFEWALDSGIAIDAITDGSSQLLSQFFEAPCPAGQLVPEEYYMILKGRTQSGEEVHVDRIWPEDYEIHTDHESVVWKIQQSSVRGAVRIEESSNTNSSPRTELLVTPPLRTFTRASEINDSNPRFGSIQTINDWLEFDCNLGTVSARLLNDDLMLVRVDHSASPHSRTIQGLGLAVSFLEGKPVQVIATETVEPSKQICAIHCHRRPMPSNRFYTPLNNDIRLEAFVERMLADATDYFLDDGTETGDLLFACLDSLDASVRTRALVLSASLERLLKILASDIVVQNPISEEQTRDILGHLRGLGCGNNVVQRFDGFIRSMDHVSPKNLLHELQKRGALGICRDDIVAWRTVRDRVAHGGWLFTGNREQKQEHITALNRLADLFVKLILNAMKYDGKYTDRYGAEIRDFTGVELSQD